jgi:hypothetical protein
MKNDYKGGDYKRLNFRILHLLISFIGLIPVIGWIIFVLLVFVFVMVFCDEDCHYKWYKKGNLYKFYKIIEKFLMFKLIK